MFGPALPGALHGNQVLGLVGRKAQDCIRSEVVTFMLVAGKLRIASANEHRRGPSTSRYKPFVMRQIREALRSG